MGDTLTVAQDRVVSFCYVLEDQSGQVLEERSADSPLIYLHGAGMILPGLERCLNGRRAGDIFPVMIEPADGHGEYNDPGPRPIPRSEFPDDVELTVGDSYRVEAGTGEQFSVWITSVGADTVHVDANHPLAGNERPVRGEVLKVRAATDAEITAGRPTVP